MASIVTCRIEDSIASVAMDDGKVNVISLRMIAELNAALDRAEEARAVVVLSGRAGVFSAGFDLPVLRAGGTEAVDMVRGGFDLAERLLSFPTPVAIACTGHAIAMGVFLLLSGDYRLGTAGRYKITANEVALGITMPRAATEILRQRLSPSHFNRAVTLAEPFSPEDAVGAGFLDRVVEAAELPGAARAVAVQLSALDAKAHAASKLRARAHTLSALRAAIDDDDAELRALT
jgi:enoyl-CoA hydratase